MFAAVSHLPHLLAYALVGDIAARADAAQLFGYAAGGFRDFTRIASSHPEMWRDICIANGDRLLQELSLVREKIEGRSAKCCKAGCAALEKLFTDARAARERLAERRIPVKHLDLAPIAPRRGHGPAAGLEEHLQPRAAARRARQGRDARCTGCWMPRTRA